MECNWGSVTIISSLEKTLNWVDVVPYISAFSGVLRILCISQIEICAGVALAGLKIFFSLVGTPDFPCKNRQIASLLTHGMFNFVRGAAAIHNFNFTLLFYDAYIGRFQYQTESRQRGVYPLNQRYV